MGKKETLQIFFALFILWGCLFLFIAIYFPEHFKSLSNHDGIAYFTPGFESINGILLTMLSVFTPILLGIMIFLMEKTKKIKISSLILITFSFTFFLSATILTIYFSILRPLSGRTPTLGNVYLIIRLSLTGLSLLMFFISSLFSNPQKTIK